MLSSLVLATTFAPLSVRQKIEDSNAVVFGTVTRTFGTKDKSKRRIVTVVTLDVERALGIQFKKIMTPKNFQVRHYGGVVGTGASKIVESVAGAPRFNIGDRVALLLRYRDNVFWVHYLAAGVFSRVTLNGQDYLRSSVFSDRPNIGLISLRHFDHILREGHLKSSFLYRPGEKNIAIFKKNKKVEREPATVYKYNKKVEYEREIPTKKNIFLILIFVALGVLFILIIQNRRRG